MARSLTEIYDQAITEKQTMASLQDLQPNIDSSQTLLSDLTTASKVAVWRLLIWVTSFLIWWHEKLFDEHKAEIEARALTLISGVTLWYRDQAFAFQYGDSVVWTETSPGIYRYIYNPVTPANQIIKRAAVIEVGGQIRIKVAKLDGGGLPTPLTIAEKDAFNAYLQKIKFAGTNITIISQDADLLKLSVTVHYDPLLLNAAGELISSPGTYPVEDAISEYIQALPFNGKLDLVALTDAIQAATGVVSPFITSAEAKAGANPFTSFNDFYTAEAGHMAIDAAFPLSGSITYTEYV